MERYIAIFVITAIWDLIWQQMTNGSIYICFSKKYEILCPNDWEWVRTGEQYFKEHSVLGAMAIAGLCGVYALAVIDLLNVLPLDKSYFTQFFVCLFASWVVGIFMRYAPDPFHTYLFESARVFYYKPLGFLLSSYSDAQSGIIVAITYIIYVFLKKKCI